jgi:hypothetical protein
VGELWGWRGLGVFSRHAGDGGGGGQKPVRGFGEFMGGELTEDGS